MERHAPAPALGTRVLLNLRLSRLLLIDARAMTAWEYALIAALITVAILGSTASMGLTTNNAFGALLTKVNWTGK